jgi:hypothetical protein
VLALAEISHRGVLNYPSPSPTGQVTSSASCVQQNPTIISMDPAADVGNTTTNIHWTQTTQTINPMDLFNTSTDPINDMTVTGDTTCNPEWTSGMTQTDGTMENINCMVMSTTPTWNQMEVSLGHFVTIVCWFWVSSVALISFTQLTYPPLATYRPPPSLCRGSYVSAFHAIRGDGHHVCTQPDAQLVHRVIRSIY